MRFHTHVTTEGNMKVFCCLVVFAGLLSTSTANMDDLWDSVVSQHVHPGTLEGISLHVVDYEGISKDANFTAYIDAIAKASTTEFGHNETYAFYMNVYNALAIKMIIDHPCDKPIFGTCHPIKSIQDIGSTLHPVWGMPAGVVAGKVMSLDDVENYLRNPQPLKEDSRVHACIVCASISCPNVRMEAFRADKVNAQMDSQFKDFLNNTKKGYHLDKAANTLTLTPIFKWFKADFDAYSGVTSFIARFIPAADVQYIATNSPDVSYFDYDWNVNGKPPCTC